MLAEKIEVHSDYGGTVMRLAKFLAHAGVASRRAAEELVRAQRVTVNGETVTDPARDVTDADAIKVGGKLLRAAPVTRAVYALNKPPGVVSTASDPQGRRTVVSLVPSATRLYPVGRLDIDTTGLILLTNDGPLAHRLTHPSFEVEKTYVAIVKGPEIRDRTLRMLREGVALEDGPSAPARARRLAPHTLELTLREGRKRQVKRMCEQVGHPVVNLQRVRFGPLELGTLKLGAHRRLTPAEIDQLRRAGSAEPISEPEAADRPRGSSSSAAPRRPRQG
jgi:23S rRNA pseudouridine2605 synthase